MEKPYGSMDPNSEHQLWSRWIFGVEACPDKQPSVQEVVDNARRYLVALFKSSVGRVRCDQQGTYYCIIAEMEGPPAHDPSYKAAVKRDFTKRFLGQGFGTSARLVRYEVGILAGDQQDGQPPDQFLVMPEMPVETKLYIS